MTIISITTIAHASTVIPAVTAATEPPAAARNFVPAQPSTARRINAHLAGDEHRDTLAAAAIMMRTLWPLYMRWGMKTAAAELVTRWENEIRSAAARHDSGLPQHAGAGRRLEITPGRGIPIQVLYVA